MDFELSAEQAAIRSAASEFAAGEFDKEIALRHEQDHTFPVDIWKKACELGFIGIHFPEKYGGQELGVLENTIVVEEFCRQDSGIGICLSIADFAAELILKFGNEQQKERYLPPVTGGKALSSGGFTEPDHGSDITLLNTSAVKDGGEYTINGLKTFITNGTTADFVLVLCQTDPDAEPTYRGQSLIIVDKDTPGFLGIAQGAFDRALAYTKERRQFGKKLAEFQVTRHKLADMATKIDTARLLVYKAAWNCDQGSVDPKLTSMAKMYAGRVAVEVADEAIQLHGGYGYMLEYEVERFYRDARITEIYEGTREIQKNTIASALLGKL
jgi:alkylation response protein AidB-like acyl-CoA dehydrogenase